MEKRGIGHIEFILSFILFITFAIFAIAIFNPIKTSKLTDSALPYATSEIIKNTSVDLTIYSVKINLADTPPGQNVIALEILNIPSDYNVRVEDYNGNILPSKKEGSIVYIDFDNQNFVLIKLSKDLEPYAPAPSETPAVNTAYYEIASSSVEKIISEKRLLALNKSYYESYELIKNNLKIPAQLNFAFLARFSEQESIISRKDMPDSVEVFSYLKRTEILRSNGGSSFADFGVNIW